MNTQHNALDANLLSRRISGMVAICALLFLLALVAGVASAGEHDHHHGEGMDAMRGVYTRSIASYKIPDIKLVDMNGEAISLREGLGGSDPVMLNFIYTTCTAICPVMSATFLHVQDQLGPESNKVRMISISIDPENDTPAKLAEYGKKFNAGPNWDYYTGSQADSVAIQKAFNYFRGDKMNHSSVVFLRGAPGKEWIRLDGFVSSDAIINELQSLSGK